MTPDQRRRLEAVAAALAPCFGCLVQDEADVDQGLGFLQPDHVAHMRAVNDRIRQKGGEAPLGRHTDEEEAEMEAQRAALRSQLEELAQLRKLLGRRGAAASRASCPACVHRKRNRRAISDLARNVREEVQRDPEDDIFVDESVDGG